MNAQFPLLLASASPRRRQIIAQLGLPFDVLIAPADEDAAQQQYKGPVEGLAQWTAAYKAIMTHTLPDTANHPVITADTTVIIDGKIQGKPCDEEEAHALLLTLRGRWHHVVTGVVVSTLIDGKLTLHGTSCTTPVLMRPYSEEEITAYIATGDPMDKAGAYGIQHPQFQPTERIDGCYLNVVGLPLCALVEVLALFSIKPAIQPRENCTDCPCPWSTRCHHTPISP